MTDKAAKIAEREQFDEWAGKMLMSEAEEYYAFLAWQARAALKAQPAQQTPEYGPVEVVSDLVRNLLALDQSTPIYAAFHVDYQGKRACRTRPVWVSRERVINGKWVDSKRTDVPYSVIVWAKPQADDKAQPAPTEAQGEPGWALAYLSGTVMTNTNSGGGKVTLHFDTIGSAAAAFEDFIAMQEGKTQSSGNSGELPAGAIGAQEFLKWNRSQPIPFVAIPMEMGVFRKAIEIHQALQPSGNAGELANGAGLQPVLANSYTCNGKGGDYEFIGTAHGAGTSRELGCMLVYMDMADGAFYFRTPTDFEDRMTALPAKTGPVAQGEDSARLDAERYRWLRDKGMGDCSDPADDALLVYQGFGENSLLPDQLDEAIDRARASAETGGVKS